jgi:uncharacterized protein (DUF2062 family)
MTWLRRRTWEPLLALLKTGLSPQGLAWSVAAGLALGVFPMLGTTTLLCVGAAFAFRLNQPAMQLVNYLAYPLQLALLIPFIRLGERLFGVPPMPLSLPAMLSALKTDTFGTIVLFWSRIWHACVVWAMVVLPLATLLALILRPVFKAAIRRVKEQAA